jgi:hypothetical protein
VVVVDAVSAPGVPVRGHRDLGAPLAVEEGIVQVGDVAEGVGGPVPGGVRANLYATGGEVTGPKLLGKVRPVGGDWLTLRTDGVSVLDVRNTLEVGEGAIVDVSLAGVGDLGVDGYERFLRGELPPTLALRASARFLSAHPEFVWLNRLQCLAYRTGAAPPSKTPSKMFSRLAQNGDVPVATTRIDCPRNVTGVGRGRVPPFFLRPVKEG